MYAIGVFGDSIAFGRGDNADRGWVGRFRKDFESKDYYNIVYNLGIPGATSTTLLERIQVECAARSVKKFEDDKFVVVVAIGLNDSRFVGEKEQTSIENFKKNIVEIHAIVNKYADKVIFIGLTSVDNQLACKFEGTTFSNDRIKQFNQVVKEQCDQYKLDFIDVFDVWKDSNLKEVLGDGLHPNTKGYEILYKYIHSQLKLA